MNLLAAMCWLSRDTAEGAEIRANRVRRTRGGEELTGRKADLSSPIRSLRYRSPEVTGGKGIRDTPREASFVYEMNRRRSSLGCRRYVAGLDSAQS